MNELKQQLELEDKEYLVATILDLQNMVDHQRRQLIIKDRSVKMFKDVSIVHEANIEDIRTALLALLRGIASGQIQGEEISFHLEQLRDSLLMI